MNDIIQMRIASLLTAAIGVALLFSPLFITITGGALISTFIVGGILTLAGIVQVFWNNTLPSWISGLTAFWLFVSAVVFSMSGGLLWMTLVAAAGAFMLALWDGIEVDEVQHHHVHA